MGLGLGCGGVGQFGRSHGWGVGGGRGKAWWEQLSNFQRPGQIRHLRGTSVLSKHDHRPLMRGPRSAPSLASTGPNHAGPGSSCHQVPAPGWAWEERCKIRTQILTSGVLGGSWARGRDGRGRGEAEGQGWRLPREVGPEDTALRDGGQQRHRGSENGHFGGMGSRVGLERGGHSPGKACG